MRGGKYKQRVAQGARTRRGRGVGGAFKPVYSRARVFLVVGPLHVPGQREEV
jgi:hypothetical protein